MKNINLSLIALGILFISACSTPSTSNPSASPSSSVVPSASSSPASGVSSQFQTRASFIAFLNCVKTKEPSLAPSLDAHINNVNSLTDAQWEGARSTYQAATQAYIASTGC